MAEHQYRRLTRARTRSVFGVVSTARASLWLGTDHLLCIETSGFNESYKRFYYRDIQAIFLRRTGGWLIVALILGLVAALFGLVAIFSGEPVAAWIFGSVSGFFVLGLVVNLLAGPSCKSYLRTAVQTEDLVSLNRVRRTRKALRRLRPLIEAAQGPLGTGPLPAPTPDVAAGTSAATPLATEDPNAPPSLVP